MLERARALIGCVGLRLQVWVAASNYWELKGDMDKALLLVLSCYPPRPAFLAHTLHAHALPLATDSVIADCATQLMARVFFRTA